MQPKMTRGPSTAPDTPATPDSIRLPRSILVVIDPTVHEQPALEKAVRLAERCGSSLELYVCDAQQSIPESWAGGARTAEYREMMRLRALAELNALAKPLRTRGLEVNTVCEWHAPLEEGIGHHVIRTCPDLVVKETHRHAPGGRAALSRTDWILIRQIPAPLLLVRAAPWPSSPRIAVAVDPAHAADRPVSLDARIVELGHAVAGAFGSRLDVLHVLQTPPHLPGDRIPPEHKAAVHAQARQQVESLAGEASTVRFDEGPAAEGLIRLVKGASIDVLMMGAVARPRWVHSAASGTAAQVLEHIGCDLLVIKPAGFVSPLMVTD